MRYVSLHGAGESVPLSAVAAGVIELRNNLRDFVAEYIFNVDETGLGLVFQLLPRRTCVTEHDTMKYVRGTETIKSKDCNTLYVCKNTVGCMVSMTVIGKAKNLRFFRIEKLPVPHFLQKMLGQTPQLFEGDVIVFLFRTWNVLLRRNLLW